MKLLGRAPREEPEQPDTWPPDLDSLGYEFDETEAKEGEARIRRMFYGRKVEESPHTGTSSG